jgi:hypothetical protein
MVAMTLPGATRIIDHDGSNGGGPPNDAKLSNLFPPTRHVLQCVHPPSANGRDDIVWHNLSPERAHWNNVCYPLAIPLAIDGKGKSQLAGGYNNHEWQRMRWWGCSALPLLRQKCSGRGDCGLPGPLLCCPVPALLLLPGTMTPRGPPQRGAGPVRIAIILHLHNGSSILGPGNSRRRGGGHSGQRSRSAREGGNKCRKGGIS